MKMLSVVKLGKGGATSIIRNQGLCRMQICGGVMVKHTSIRVTQGSKISLKPRIVPHKLRMRSERGVNFEETLVTGNKV